MASTTLRSIVVLIALATVAGCPRGKLSPAFLDVLPTDPNNASSDEQAEVSWTIDDSQCPTASMTARANNLRAGWEGLSAAETSPVGCRIRGTVSFPPYVYPRSISATVRGFASADGGTISLVGSVGLRSPKESLSRVEQPTADAELVVEQHVDLRGAREAFCTASRPRKLSWSWQIDLSVAGQDQLASIDSLNHVVHLGHCHEPDYELMCPWLRSTMGNLARLADGGIDESDLRLALVMAQKFDTNDLRSNCAGEQPGFRPGDIELLHKAAWTALDDHADALRPHLDTWCDANPSHDPHDNWSAAAVQERKCLAQSALERLGELGRDCGCSTPF